MTPGTTVAGTVAAMATTLALALSGCGQVELGDQPPGTADPATPPTSPATASAATTTPPASAEDPTASASPPSPGPGATPGCESLTGPVHRLVHGTATDRGATSTEVRRLADGVADNALSAVASRLSGIAVQPTVSPAALRDQWDQFRRLCDLP